jgi:RHH-type proline utilization regulon transcriptional repressor/proline dehydrogenase/delta 1-pyrroline-5-carboxylate dehydrogenase
VAVDSAVSVDLDRLEAEVLEVGRAIAARMEDRRRSVGQAIDDRAMALAAGDRELRAAMFRLVDVTPACRGLDDLGRHLAGLVEQVPDQPPPVVAAMRAAHTKAGRVALGAAVATGVRHMAHRFIAGADANSALGELERLWRRGIGFSADLLGEATVTAAEADAYAARCAETLELLAAGAVDWPAKEVLERDSVGSLPRVNLSVKVSALTPVLRPGAPEVGEHDAARRLRPLFRRGRDLGVHLHIDMESLDSRETTLELIGDLLADPGLRDGPSAGLVLQAYLRDSPGELERIIAWSAASDRRPPLVVRLVKGAYWDHEAAEAAQRGWSAPVFTDKAECDRNFEALTRRLLDARPVVRVAVASHNLRSVAHAIAYNRLTAGEDRDLELQVLRGLGDELADALAAEGHRVRVYSPLGELVAGMAYLVRRLLENTSNESFLAHQAQGEPIEKLLAAP